MKREDVLPVIMDVTNKDEVKLDGDQLFWCDKCDESGHSGHAKAAAFLYSIIESGNLPMRVLIGKKCCEDVRGFLGDRISEIDSYIEDSSQTDY